MAVQEIPGNADISTIIPLINNLIRESATKEIATVFKDTTGVRRVILGRLPNGIYGMAVSKPGFDVFSAFS